MKWPWPGDSREDRVKRVGVSAIALMEQMASGTIEDPLAAVELWHRGWQDLSVFWTRPTCAPLDLEQWLPAKEVAELFGKVPRDMYDWSRRGHVRVQIAADGTALYSVLDVKEYIQRRWLQRQGREGIPIDSS